MENRAPTKSNLISAQVSLQFSLKGFELLDKKRNVLIRAMMSYVKRAEKLQKDIKIVFKEAYEGLKNANITMGISTVEDIALAMREDENYTILLKSIMGVEVPRVVYDKIPIVPQYSLYRSNSAMDLAYEKFNNVKYLIYELAEVENAVCKLAIEVKKTQKRANALQNIQIPRLKQTVKVISEVLEEKEREDFFRLKVVKKKKRSF